MKTKYVLGALAAALVIGGLWLAREGRRAPAIEKSSGEIGVGAAVKTPEAGARDHQAQPGHSLRPPDPTRQFRELTPEQRVEQARKGHGPGG